MKRAITTVLGPNYESGDVWLAFRWLITPWRWRRSQPTTELEADISRWLPVRHAVSFSSGRGALLAILQAAGLQPGDEVLVQAFTCVSVPAAVRWAGGHPVYVDTDATTYTMDVCDVEQKITPRTRVIIIQHTFGYPADLARLCAVARAHQLFVIEDCAHALGARYRGKHVGTFGDAAMFSFGRDKVISAVFGGMAVTDDAALAVKLRAAQGRAVPAPARWIVQQLLHPLVTFTARRWLNFLAVGKILLRLARRFRLTVSAIEDGERRADRPRLLGYRMPAALAALARYQFGKLERYNAHRELIARCYRQHLPAGILPPPASTAERTNLFLMYSIRCDRREELLDRLQRAGIYLEAWYSPVIAPPGTDLAAVGYTAGSCPRAEEASRTVVNLPTHIAITPADAQRIVDALRA